MAKNDNLHFGFTIFDFNINTGQIMSEMNADNLFYSYLPKGILRIMGKYIGHITENSNAITPNTSISDFEFVYELSTNISLVYLSYKHENKILMAYIIKKCSLYDHLVYVWNNQYFIHMYICKTGHVSLSQYNSDRWCYTCKQHDYSNYPKLGYTQY